MPVNLPFRETCPVGDVAGRERGRPAGSGGVSRASLRPAGLAYSLWAIYGITAPAGSSSSLSCEGTWCFSHRQPPLLVRFTLCWLPSILAQLPLGIGLPAYGYGFYSFFTAAITVCDRSTFSARHTSLRWSMLILLYLPALLGWSVVPLWLKVMLRLYARLVFTYPSSSSSWMLSPPLSPP